MKYLLAFSSIIMLLLPVSADSYCHQDECFTDKAELFVSNDQIVHIYYNSLFEIGENWFIVIWLENGTNNDIDLRFDFGGDISKTIEIKNGSSNYTDSLSFSGSTFSSEKFDTELNVSFNGNKSMILEIDVNKKPAEDMFYLWGGMSVFWFAIGTYVLYISNKLRVLSKRIEGKNE